MARLRRSTPGMDSFEDLARKIKILEREMAQQRRAMDRLKEIATERRLAPVPEMPSVRKSA